MNLISPIAKKAFTLIELLVVVAIIGILASVGVYGFSNFTQSGKKSATIANWNQATTYIKNTFGQCQLKGNKGTIVLSPTAGSINCEDIGTKASVLQIAATFQKYFIEIGFKNPYDNKEVAVAIARNYAPVGSIRLDETECPAGTSGFNHFSRARMIVWRATHEEQSPTLIEMGSWCKY
jgi:prepilin-type N-terminal cleavage/methylation domain-containing protein